MVMSHKDTTWNQDKAEQIIKELRQADQILVGIGDGFTAAAGVEPLPLDKSLSREQYCRFWLPYIDKQRLNKNVPVLYQQLAQLLPRKGLFYHRQQCRWIFTAQWFGNIPYL